MTLNQCAAHALVAVLAALRPGCDTMKPRAPAAPPPPSAASLPTEVAGPSPVRGPSPLVFAKGRIAMFLPGGTLQVRSLPDLAVKLELPAHAAFARADGTLVALSWDKLCTLAPDNETPECRRKLTVAPPGLGWAWGDESNHVWVIEGAVARSYALEGDKIRLAAELKLAAATASDMAPLPDGSVLWADNVALHHQSAHGSTDWSPSAESGVILHVAAGPPGQAWVSQAKGTLTLVQVAAKLEPVSTIRGDRILSLSATKTHVATVVGDSPRLVVRQTTGAQVLERPLPPSFHALSVALSPFAPFVAVGGYGELAVWSLDGKLLGQTP